jgi:hypothetical protein
LKAANTKETPKSYVWYHHQDEKTMQLVSKKLNNFGGVSHIGGSAVIKHNNANPNDQLRFPLPKTS